MKSLDHHLVALWLTLCSVVGTSPLHANSGSTRSSSPSLAEQVQALATQCTAIRDAHAASLRVLENDADFALALALRALRRDLTQLTDRLPTDAALSQLAQRARDLAAQLAKQLPSGQVDPATASLLDRDALATARQAEHLRKESSAIQKELSDTLEQAQKWENAFHAFDFDPRRQNQIVRSLIADRRSSLTEPAQTPQMELDPELATKSQNAIAALNSTPTPPANNATFSTQIPPAEPVEPLQLPAPATEQTLEMRWAIVNQDPLHQALQRLLADPNDPTAQQALNQECFKHLIEIGPQVLRVGHRFQLPTAILTQLETAARLKSPAALHLLALMHLTGQGSGLNYPRGTAFLKEATKRLESHPEEPFGPGIETEAANQAISQVGTSWFWLAESYLLGLMEQQPETAATLYRTAASRGDPRAHQRLRQLTAVDRSRVFISWPPENADSALRASMLGLVEHCGTDLDAIEDHLANRAKLTAKSSDLNPTTSTPPEETVDLPPPDILRPYLGIDFTENFPIRGVAVQGVLYGSPADQAGLQPGDLIVQVNERSTSTLADFHHCLNQVQPGDAIQFRVLRPDHQPLLIQLKLGTITALSDSIEAVLEPLHLPSSWNPHQVGFRIMSVRPGSAAALSGLRSGDIALAANDRHLRRWNDLAAALYSHHRITTVLVQRRIPGTPPQLVSVVISAD
jgi:TPR repeat protein